MKTFRNSIQITLIHWMLLVLSFFTLKVGAQGRFDENGLKHGSWSEKYDNGTVKYRGNFEHGKPTGTFVYNYQSGQKRAEITHRGDSSEAVFYYEGTGNLMGKGSYYKQKKVGLWVFYHVNDTMSSKEYYKDGLQHGSSVTYYQSGKILQRKNFVEGVEDGLSTQYFQNGRKRSEENYKMGVLDGKAVDYYANGGFRAIGKYIDGVKEGTWSYYNNDGTLHYRELYVGGRAEETIKMNGTFEEYYQSEVEILKSRMTYKEGKLHGPFEEFYEVGEWKFKLKQYKEDPLMPRPDEYVRYFDGQKTKRKGSYKMGKLHGKVTYYNEDGSLDKIENYQDGVLIAD